MARVAPQTQDQDQLKPPIRRAFYPVDTLVQAPQAPTTNQYLQLAQALSSVNPKIQNFLQHEQAQYVNDQTQQGRDDAIRVALSYQEGVRRGLIPADQSPIYQRAYKEIYGQNQGDDFAAQLQQDAVSSGVLNNPDPNAIHSWVQQQAQAKMQGMDPDVAQGFLPKVLQAHKSLDQMYRRQQTTNTVNGMIDGVSTQFSNILDQYQGEVDQSGGTWDPAEAAKRLNAAASLPKFAGLDSATVDKLMLKAVSNKALTERDPDILETLNQTRQGRLPTDGMVPGPGMTAEGRNTISTMTEHISAAIARDNAAEYAQQEHDRKQQTQAVSDAAANEMATTGHLSADTLVKAGKTSSDALNAVMAIQEKTLQIVRAQREVSDYVDSGTMARVFADLHTGNYGANDDGSPKTPTQWAVEQAKNLPPGQVRQFMDEAVREQNTGLYANADYKRAIGQISGEIQDPLFGQLFRNPGDKSTATNLFAAHMAQRVDEMKAKGTYTPDNVRIAVAEEQQAIIKQYTATKGEPKPAPAAEPEKAAEMSPSGLPKLDRVTPADVRAARGKYNINQQVTQDLQNKYTPKALKEAFPDR